TVRRFRWAAGIPPLRALVTDDEPALRDPPADFLPPLVGVETVDVAADGTAGLALFARHPYDLVLTDFLMPGLTGAEVVEALQRRNPAAKIVMVTGSAIDEDIAGGREPGLTVLPQPLS